MIDPVEFGKQMAAIVREAAAPLHKRIDELEKALAEKPDHTDISPAVDVGEIAKAAAQMIRAPQDGKSITVEDVAPMIDAAIQKAIAEIPAPAAPSATEIASAFEPRFSELVLSWERQARDVFEKAVDRMPKPRDGKDAIQLDSLEAVMLDERTLSLRLSAGDEVLEKSVRIPALIDQGVFSREKAYEKGDGVTYGGCFWIAQKDAPEGVPGGSDGWRLAVKKGRDGKDLRDSAATVDTSKGVSIQ